MTEPQAFYEAQHALFTTALQTAKKKLNLSSTIRLIVFLAVAAGIYFALGNTQLIIGIIVAGIIAFLFLVTRHSKLKYERDLNKGLIERNELELKILKRDFYDLPEGEEHHHPEHVYSQDIDLFGRGSFYQYLNRTALTSGSEQLAKMLLSNDINAIEEKQEAVKELSQLPEWRQRFGAIASLVETEVSAGTVSEWLEEYKSFTPSSIKIVSRIFSAISLLTMAAYFFNFIAGWWVFVVFGIGLAITGKYVKKINGLSVHTGKIQSTFEQYAKLLSEIEEQEFESDTLSRKRKTIISTGQSSSSILKKFSKHLDAFDQRNNILVGIISNGFFFKRSICSIYY